MEITGATLLSTNEAKQLDKEILKASGDWWLSSRGEYEDGAACVLGDVGDVYGNGYYVNYSFGVRPALTISDLESSNLEIGDTVTFGEHDFTIISDKYALCDEIIGGSAFREDWQAKDANDYEASDVKKFVDDWFAKVKEQSKDTDKVQEEGEREV